LIQRQTRAEKALFSCARAYIPGPDKNSQSVEEFVDELSCFNHLANSLPKELTFAELIRSRHHFSFFSSTSGLIAAATPRL
jgi:hypothetical protein